MANLISFLILIVFFYGRSLHAKNLRLHIRLMAASLIADYLLVLGLVIFREALGEVHLGMHWTLMVHIPFALASVVLYALTARTGYQLWKGSPVRAQLRRYDRLLVFARLMTFVTSLMVEFLR